MSDQTENETGQIKSSTKPQTRRPSHFGYRPHRSLRTILMIWFITFSFVPLMFVAGYSVKKYEQAITKEQAQRLFGNKRELETVFKEFENTLVNNANDHVRDRSLIYYLSRGMKPEERTLAKRWLLASIAHRISFFDGSGRLQVSLYKNEIGEVKSSFSEESKPIFLNEEFLKSVGQQETSTHLEVKHGQSMELIVFSQIRTGSERLVGYVEEIIELDKGFLEGLKKRMDLEVVFFTKSPVVVSVDQQPIISSHGDLELYPTQFFFKQLGKEMFDLNIRGVAYGFIVKEIPWGNKKLYVALGTSKSAAESVLQNLKYAFFTMVVAFGILLLFLSFFISQILLKPLSDLLNNIRSVRPGEEIPPVDSSSKTELGVLVESFNDMSKKINDAQKELKLKISELEQANLEIKETQAKLVHTAKMASLGQLVAGVAHELNNPIGFIYSNMEHLRTYSASLIELVEKIEKHPQLSAKYKEEMEFDYLVEDLPKLIKSCEDGARRTRDIVLGLRNFSRLEEAKEKEIDLEESIENTLNLLAGEIKSRIKIEKEFSKIPKVFCYPSQLNQVFMNILSNAVQAIPEEGTVHIKTSADGEFVNIEISDTGKGMDEVTQSQIFDPFFTTKGVGEGTGLGLSISYGIVQNHGGDIQVHSQKGKGTTFIVRLPKKSHPQ